MRLTPSPSDPMHHSNHVSALHRLINDLKDASGHEHLFRHKDVYLTILEANLTYLNSVYKCLQTAEQMNTEIKITALNLKKSLETRTKELENLKNQNGEAF